MKKIYYLIATAIMALTFTSCEDVPAPFGQPVERQNMDSSRSKRLLAA